MKIFGRLMFAFGALAIICAVIGGIGWYSLRVTNKQLAEITDVNLPAVEALGQVLEAQNAIRSSERTLFRFDHFHRELRVLITRGKTMAGPENRLPWSLY